MFFHKDIIKQNTGIFNFSDGDDLLPPAGAEKKGPLNVLNGPLQVTNLPDPRSPGGQAGAKPDAGCNFNCGGS